MTTAGLVLAAGEGKRFGGPKAPYVHNGQRLVDRAVQVLAEAGCDPVFVVLGAWLGEVPNATVLENQNWKSGMGSSLQVGLATLNGESEIDEVLVSLVDLPGLTSAAVTRVVNSLVKLWLLAMTESVGIQLSLHEPLGLSSPRVQRVTKAHDLLSQIIQKKLF